jgi:hypothetical protein
VAITRRPKSSEAAEVNVEALINKGGSIPKRDATSNEGTVAIVLRLPTDILARVDQSVKARPIRTPRHTWLLEAVHEKLTRDET